MATAALRLIALTGLRREEACALRWNEIDLVGCCLRLETTKTGRSMRPIGKPARDLLQSCRGCRMSGCSPIVTAQGGPS